MSEVVIRRGDLADRPFVLDLGKRTLVTSLSSLRSAPTQFLEASYDRLLVFAFRNAYVLLIAQDEFDGPLGFVLLISDLPDEVAGISQGFVAYMAVEPEARRRGIGAKLLAAAETAVRERGHRYIALMVTEDNAPARELYAQAGYVTERRLLCKSL